MHSDCPCARRLDAVVCQVTVSRSSRAPKRSAAHAVPSKGGVEALMGQAAIVELYSRWGWDGEACQVLTDAAPSAFVLDS